MLSPSLGLSPSDDLGSINSRLIPMWGTPLGVVYRVLDLFNVPLDWIPEVVLYLVENPYRRAAIVGAAGGLLGVRAGINAITWVFGMALASPAPRLGFARTARLMFDEYLAFLLTFVLVIPFERLWMPADRLAKGKQPILLVHGYGCSRGVWWLLRRRLEAAGHTVASVSLAPPHISLGRLEPILSQRIEAVCAATGSPQVTLIGHSMGGHGALTLALKYPEKFKSVSAFAPICAPSQCPWGEKAFSNYLGDDSQAWLAHDAAALMQSKGALFSEILIDQGLNDQFYSQLNPALFQQACEQAGQALTLREHAGYDHGYYFIQSFMDDHLQFHALQLQNS